MNQSLPDDIDVIWQPIPDSSQEFAINTRAQHTLYHGARGPGKTITQLMRFALRVGMGYGSYWKGVIFDREFQHLGDLATQGNRFFPKLCPGVQWKKSAQDYKWVWPDGEELLLRHVKREEDYSNFHGHEYAFLGWNELTKQPTSDLYDMFMSVNRSSFTPELHTPHDVIQGKKVYRTQDKKPLPPIPLEVFSTTNPNGPGRNWVKKKFINVAKSGEVVKNSVSYYDPKKKEDVVVERTQVAIFGSFYENPYLDPIYKAGLIEMCETNPNKRAAWIEGSWDVSDGGAIDDIWDARVHIIGRIPIPSGWKVNRSFDWGSTHPFAVIWWAEANGEECVYYDKFGDKHTWCPQRGSLIGINEWYGTSSRQNRGLKLSARDIAVGINDREKRMIQEGWVEGPIQSGPADNQIRDVREVDVDTIEYKMSVEGVHWTKSDKTRGSRKVGLQLMREMLQASVTREGPGIYYMTSCPHCIETLPVLPRCSKDEDDVDTDAEDHLWDTTRYRVLEGSNHYITDLAVTWNR